MDKLSHLIEELVSKRWKGLKLGKQGIMVLHLMFADDLLIFGKAFEDQITCVMETLDNLCHMSGKEISEEKTNILFF